MIINPTTHQRKLFIFMVYTLLFLLVCEGAQEPARPVQG
jgi:hypothetical protein